MWKFLMSEDCKENNKVNFILKTFSQLANVKQVASRYQTNTSTTSISFVPPFIDMYSIQ